MENHYDIRRLALVLAISAEVEGMKANNKIHEMNNAVPPFNNSDFQQKAEQLRNLAYCHDQQLY